MMIIFLSTNRNHFIALPIGALFILTHLFFISAHKLCVRACFCIYRIESKLYKTELLIADPIVCSYIYIYINVFASQLDSME